MGKQKSILRVFMIFAICLISLSVFKTEASANSGEVRERRLDRDYDLDGFPLVYTGEWLFQIKADEAVIIAYFGEDNNKDNKDVQSVTNKETIDSVVTPTTLRTYDDKKFPVKAIGYNAFSPSNSNFVKAKKIMKNTDVNNRTNIWNINSVTISEGVDTIADGAFSRNTGIVSCSLPGSLNESGIGTSCFSGCTNLEIVNIPGRVTIIPSSCFKNCQSLKTIELHSGINSIGGSAFYGCTAFSTISLPNSIKKIGASAFEDCTNLNEINIPTGVDAINSRTFAHCNVLKNVVVPKNVESIGSYAFAYRVYGLEYELDFNWPSKDIPIKPVILNEGLKRIDANAFYDIPIMREISIPDSVETIGSNAFGYYESKAGVRPIPTFTIIGHRDTEAEEYANSNSFKFDPRSDGGIIIETKDAKYATTEIRGEVTLIHNDKTSATSFTVPATISKGKRTYTVTAIADNAFKGSKYLKTVSTGDEVKTIGKGAFKGCKALEKVKTGTKLQTIGDEAFAECKKLKEVTLEKGVKTIGKKAFYNCKKLEKMTIKSKKLNKVGAKAFKNINKKAVFELPGNKVKSYKKKINKAGAPKKVTYSKIKSTK